MASSFKYHHGHTGAFLLEIVFASFLFTAVFGAIITVWVHHDRALSLTKQNGAANLIAEKPMNQCLANGFYHVDEIAEAGPRTVEVVHEIDEVEHVARYTTSVQVDLQPDEDLKLVTVMVKFNERGVEKKVERHHVLYWQN